MKKLPLKKILLLCCGVFLPMAVLGLLFFQLSGPGRLVFHPKWPPTDREQISEIYSNVLK